MVAAFTDETGLGASKAPSADPAFAGPAWQGKGALLEADFMARESGSRVLPSDECAPGEEPAAIAELWQRFIYAPAPSAALISAKAFSKRSSVSLMAVVSAASTC